MVTSIVIALWWTSNWNQVRRPSVWKQAETGDGTVGTHGTSRILEFISFLQLTQRENSAHNSKNSVLWDRDLTFKSTKVNTKTKTPAFRLLHLCLWLVLGIRCDRHYWAQFWRTSLLFLFCCCYYCSFFGFQNTLLPNILFCNTQILKKSIGKIKIFKFAAILLTLNKVLY